MSKLRAVRLGTLTKYLWPWKTLATLSDEVPSFHFKKVKRVRTKEVKL